MDWNKIKKNIIAFYIFLTLVLAYSAYLIFCLAGPHNLTVYFFNVGQGDSVLIRTPQFQNIIIDGGVDNTLMYKLGEYLPYFDRTIDLMVLTHPDSDHLIGLVEVLKRYRIKAILFTDINAANPAYDRWKKLALENNCRLLTAGQINDIILVNNSDLKILYPEQNLAGQKFKDANDSSLVLKLNYGQTSFLFTGDAPAKIENILIKQNAELAADVLKISHHGSNISTTNQFLDKVKPAMAIISVGQNHFNHPTPAVIARLAEHRIETLITQNLGDVIIRSDGQKISAFDPAFDP